MIESPIIGAISAGIKWLLGLLPAILGAGISIVIKNSEKEKLDFRQKWIFFFCGVMIAYIFSNAAFEIMKLKYSLIIEPLSFIGIALTCSMGIFGMGLTVQCYKQLPAFLRKLWEKLLDLIPSLK